MSTTRLLPHLPLGDTCVFRGTCLKEICFRPIVPQGPSMPQDPATERPDCVSARERASWYEGSIAGIFTFR